MATRPTILSQDEKARFLADAAFAGSYRKDVRERIAEIEARPDLILPPPWGWPKLNVRDYGPGEGERYRTPGRTRVVRFVLLVAAQAALAVRMGPFVVEIAGGQARHAAGTVDLADRPLKIAVVYGRRGSSSLIIDDAVVDRSTAPERDFAFSVVTGAVGFLQALSWGRSCAVREPATPGERDSPFRYPWEKTAHGVYGTLFACVMAAELADGDEGFASLAERARAIAVDLMTLFEAAPQWRPASGLTPDRDWDWNGWSNGMIPGAYACCARLLGRDDDPAVREVFTRRATDWLNHPSFPKPRHWNRRSTNHGVVVLGAYLVGARLLGLAEDPGPRAIAGRWDQVMAAAFSDGCFREGLQYYRFSITHLLAHYWLRWKADGRDWPAFAAEALAFLGPVPTWLNHATASDGAPFANFGDVFEKQWNDGVSTVLPQAAVGGLAAHVPARPEPKRPYAPLVRLLPAPPAGPNPEGPPPHGTVVAAFPDSGMASIDAYRDGRKTGGLFVFGSTLHLTHNKTHDCGGFVFEAGGRPVVVARPSKSSIDSNAVTPVDGPSLASVDSVRDYSGTARILAGAAGPAILSQVDYGAAMQAASGLVALRRMFLPLSGGDGGLAILSRWRGRAPALVFNLAARDWRLTAFDLAGEPRPLETGETSAGVHYVVAPDGPGEGLVLTLVQPADAPRPNLAGSQDLARDLGIDASLADLIRDLDGEDGAEAGAGV